MIRSWKNRGFSERLSSGGFHHDGSLDDDAGCHIFPERHQQLSRLAQGIPQLGLKEFSRIGTTAFEQRWFADFDCSPTGM